eukprot:1151873-Pelagomonas_calceolata.AAC.1
MVRKVLQADKALSIIPGVNCWTAEVLTAFWGLQRSELRLAHTAVSGLEWLNSLEPRGHNYKRTTYHRWLASPLNPFSAEAAPCKGLQGVTRGKGLSQDV